MLQTALHWLGFGLCHQLPERSFFGGGVQAPVCARDTGIYVGFCVAIVLISLLHRPKRPRGFPSPLGWVAFGLMIGSMAIDGGTQLIGLRSSANDLRLITGLLSGFAIAMLLVPMLNDSVWRTSHNQRVLDPPWRLGVFRSGGPGGLRDRVVGRATPRRRVSNLGRHCDSDDADVREHGDGVSHPLVRAQGREPSGGLAGGPRRTRLGVLRDLARRTAQARLGRACGAHLVDWVGRRSLRVLSVGYQGGSGG